MKLRDLYDVAKCAKLTMRLLGTLLWRSLWKRGAVYYANLS